VAESPSAHSTRNIGSGRIVLRFVEDSKSEAKRKPDFGHDRYFQMQARSGGREIMEEVEENVCRTHKEKVDSPNLHHPSGDPSRKIPKIDDDPKH
jgi:hypothetical protein